MLFATVDLTCPLERSHTENYVKWNAVDNNISLAAYVYVIRNRIVLIPLIVLELSQVNVPRCLGWALLMFHAEQEDAYMTAPMPDFQPAQDNEAEHAELGEIIGGLTECITASESGPK